MIKDSVGNEISYWPISGLVEGEDSETLDFTLELSGSLGVFLHATASAKCKFWARKVGDVSWKDIAVDPYDVSGLTGDVDFEGYVEALTPITGLERVPVSVFVGSSEPAGWLA